jgi:type II secretory pathway pseudopilin PulG
MKINNNKGITLLEVIIAMTISILVMTFITGIYLSSASIMKDDSTNADRVAQIVSMHMTKNLRFAASNFAITKNSPEKNDVTLRFRVNADPMDSASITSSYVFDSSRNEILYYPSSGSAAILISRNISGVSFTPDLAGPGIQVNITASTGNGKSEFTAKTYIQPVNTAYPAVYTVG